MAGMTFPRRLAQPAVALRRLGGPLTSERLRPLLRWAPVPIALAALFFGWEAYVAISDIQPQVLPAPSRVFQEGWEFRGRLLRNTAVTMQETAIGFPISLVVATLLAVAIDFSGLLRRALYPLLVASQTLPLIVLAPLMITWVGFGLEPKIVLIVLVTFFPVTVGWNDGLNSTERKATNLLRSMGANRRQIFWHVRLPSALPSFFSGLRIAITYAVVAAIFAEWAGAKEGLGIFMRVQWQSFRIDLVLAAVIVTALVSVLLFLSTYVVERAAIPWYFATRRQHD